MQHTLSNNKVHTIADLSALVESLITHMCPIGPRIQVYVADSIISRAWHLHISITVSQTSNLSPKLHKAMLYNGTTLSPDKNVDFGQTVEDIVVHPVPVFLNVFLSALPAYRKTKVAGLSENMNSENISCVEVGLTPHLAV